MFELLINDSKDPKAAYIGWAPARCRVRVPDQRDTNTYTLKLRNESQENGGQIVFLSEPTKAATFDDGLTVTISHEEPAIFYIAGKFGHPSIDGQDTSITIQIEGSDDIVLSRSLMVRVRKNANNLTRKEQERIINAFDQIRLRPSQQGYTPPTREGEKMPQSILDELALMHSEDAATEIHLRGNFHPWHRIFLLHVERELQRVDPAVTIPYWKFDEKAENVFTQDFVGETEHRSAGPNTNPTAMEVKVKFKDHHPWRQWKTVWGPLYRNYLNANFNPAKTGMANVQSEKVVLNASSDFIEWRDFEEFNSHNPAHGGFGGLVADIGKDPVDPLFHMLHSNVDRLWAKWQKMHNRMDPEDTAAYPYSRDKSTNFPFSSYRRINRFSLKNLQIGNFLEDRLWPWDWDYTYPRPNPDEPIFTDQFPRVQPNIKLHLPTSPSVRYPQSSPTVKDTVDYHGELDWSTNLGFDYDDVPYFQPGEQADPLVFGEYIQEQLSLFSIVMDSNQTLGRRFSAINNLRLIPAGMSQQTIIGILNSLNTQEEEEAAFALELLEKLPMEAPKTVEVLKDIILDDSKPTSMRVRSIELFKLSKRTNEAFYAHKPAVFAKLRTLLNTEDRALRLAASTFLATEEDPDAQEHLQKQLNDNPDPVSRQESIFLLSLTPHANHFPKLKEIVEDSNDTTEVREEAALALSRDLTAKIFLEKTFNDQKAPEGVRVNSMMALSAQDPGFTSQIATEILSKDGGSQESEAIQTILLHEVVHLGSHEQILEVKNQLSSSESKLQDFSTKTQASMTGMRATSSTDSAKTSSLDQLRGMLEDKVNQAN